MNPNSTNTSISFSNPNAIQDTTDLLMDVNNISHGRDIAILLKSDADNRTTIERWLRSEVWRHQLENSPLSIEALSQSLVDYLATRLWEIRG